MKFIVLFAFICPVFSLFTPQKYIVTFKKDFQLQSLYYRHQDSIHSMKWFSFMENGYSVHGYSAEIRPDILETIKNDPYVDYIEHDSPVHILDLSTKTLVHQENAPWGLSRISADKTNDGNFYYQDTDGEGVVVYIIDTGVFIEHDEFENRAVWGKTVPSDEESKDGNGHGTHCAGIVAGKTYGVCKKCKIIAVKVLRADGSGSMSDVIEGVEWVINHHNKHGKNRKGSVVNMSLGGSKSMTLNRAVESAVDIGIHFVVAGGNDFSDSCLYSPASSEKAITVGATDKDDNMAFFSNYGECVNIFAPGHQIKSSWIGGKNAFNTISGTSMASPATAGVVAALLSRKKYGGITPKEMQQVIFDISTKNVLKDIPGNVTVNALLNNDAKSTIRFTIQ